MSAFVPSVANRELFVARVLPLQWKRGADYGDALRFSRSDRMLVLASYNTARDGSNWWHVSMSKPSELPSWADVREAKDLFVGRERKAIIVLPKASEYVNLHPHCMHLWSPLETDPLPDFRQENGQI